MPDCTSGFHNHLEPAQDRAIFSLFFPRVRDFAGYNSRGILLLSQSHAMQPGEKRMSMTKRDLTEAVFTQTRKGSVKGSLVPFRIGAL